MGAGDGAVRGAGALEAVLLRGLQAEDAADRGAVYRPAGCVDRVMERAVSGQQRSAVAA